MKKTILLLMTLVAAVLAKAQSYLPVQYDTLPLKGEVILWGNADMQTSGLEKEFANKLRFGGTITNAMKDRSMDRHRDINRFGQLIHSEIEYRNYQAKLFGMEKWGYLLKGGYYYSASGIYSKDFFGMIFYGNEDYLGKTVDFSGTSTLFTGFQKLGFGAINKVSKSSVTLSLVNVSNYYQGSTPTGKITQNAAGDSIELAVDGTFSYTDKKQFSNGLGLAVDVDFRIPISWTKNQKAYIRIQANNLGFAWMNQGVQSYSADSTYHYAGFDFEQLFAGQALFSDDFSVLDSLGIRSENVRKIVMLPGFIQVGKIVDEHHAGKWQSFFGIRLYPTLTFNPMVYAGGNYRPVSWLDLGLSGSYGGFGAFRAGLYASFRMKNFSLGVGTEDAYGVFSRKAYGNTLNLRLRCKL